MREEQELPSGLVELVLRGDFEGVVQYHKLWQREGTQAEWLVRAARFCLTIPSEHLYSFVSFIFDSGFFLLAAGLIARMLEENRSEELTQLRHGALRAYGAINSWASYPDGYPFVANRFCQRAEDEMGEGEYRAALKLFERALQEGPFHAEAMKGAARCRMLLRGSADERELIARFEEEVQGDLRASTWFKEAAAALRESALSQEELSMQLIRDKLEREFNL